MKQINVKPTPFIIDKNVCKLLFAVFAAFAILVSLNACGKKLPDPVERKDGYAYIPIANTVFLVPEKTWLKSYGRKSTDGSVDSFYVHATAPDVQPWSKEVNDQMYPALGPGKMVRVYVKDDREILASQYEYFFRPPNSRWSRNLVEVVSDQQSNGLRKFRDSISSRTIIYERIENERVIYFINCNEDKDPPHRQFCYLSYPWNRAIYVELSFTRNYLPSSIQMAEQITAKLKEFESAGQAYRHNQPSNQN